MLRRDLDPNGDLSNDNPSHKILDLDTNKATTQIWAVFLHFLICERERERDRYKNENMKWRTKPI